MSKEFTVSLRSASVKNHGNLYLSVQNLTDSSQTYQVRARHLEDQLIFTPEDQQIQIAPQATSELSIGVSVRSRRVWQPADYDFDIIVGTVDVQDHIQGHLSVAPPPLFWLMLITILFALLVGIVIGAFFTLEQRMINNQALMDELLSLQQQQTTAVAELELNPSEIPAQPTVAPTETAVSITITPSKTATAPAPTATITPTLDLLATVARAHSYEIKENSEQPIELLADDVTRSDYLILSQSKPTKGDLEPTANGPYIYRPTPDYFGPDSFTYQVCLAIDASDCVTNSVTLNITGVNDPPEADDDQITLKEDDGIQTLTVILLDGDIDKDRDPLTIDGVIANSDRVIFISVTANSASAVRYDPGDFYTYLAKGETASETFQYTIVDPTGERSVGNVTVNIEGVNNAPIANNDLIADEIEIVVSAEGLTDFPVSMLLANDTDPDKSDLEKLALNTVENDLVGGSVVQIDGIWRFDPKGVYTDLAQNETAVETITYTVIDPHGGISKPATAQITVQGVNDPPTLGLLTQNPLTIQPVFSSTISSTVTSTITLPINRRIISDTAISDIDGQIISRILIRYAGNFTRPDGSNEHVAVTFEGDELISEAGFIEISTEISIETAINILKSTRYVNVAATPAADCRRIDFQVFDKFGAESNIVSLLLEVGGGSCQTSGKIGSERIQANFHAGRIS
ncbi:MAG: VCBS repeat-containing protein [Cellvibrionaceae bacterium]|jgi:VCBS repeat-containing protein